MRIEVNVLGLEEIEAIMKSLQDPALVVGILEDAEPILLNRIRTRFLAETDPDGTPWEPSKAGMRRRGKGGTGTLFDTGNLFHSIQLFRKDEEQLVFGTDVYYAHWHNDGTGGHTQRLFMGFSDDDIDVMLQLIAKRIEEAING